MLNVALICCLGDNKGSLMAPADTGNDLKCRLLSQQHSYVDFH